MVNSRASGTTLRQLIETHLATGTAATKTFTFPAIDWDKVAYLELSIDITATAQLALEMIYNAVTTNYYSDGIEVTAGAANYINVGAIAHNEILSTAMLAGANVACSGTIRIWQSEYSTNYTSAVSDFVSTGPRMSHVGHTQNSDLGDLTGITITTSTSTWTAATRMSLYKILR